MRDGVAQALKIGVPRNARPGRSGKANGFNSLGRVPWLNNCGDPGLFLTDDLTNQALALVGE